MVIVLVHRSQNRHIQASMELRKVNSRSNRNSFKSKWHEIDGLRLVQAALQEVPSALDIRSVIVGTRLSVWGFILWEY